MLFEDYSYDEILARMLSNVTTNVDKREGSIIFDTLSPAALEFAQAYINMDIILSNAFAETAEREYLIRIAKERGLSPESATYAVLRAEFNFNSAGSVYGGEYVAEGDRFNLDSINYVLTEQLTNSTGDVITVTGSDGGEISVKAGEVIPGVWAARCETAGTEGNRHLGTLTPITTITGLTKAELTEVLIYGEDDEDTETFRQRYFDSINSDAFGGNRADYINWVKAMDGVGQVKVIRTPNGGGTVEVIITNSANEPDEDGNLASAELMESVKEALDPAETTGQGDGIAPIGHSVTVSTVSTQQVNVTLSNITYEEDAEEESVKSAMIAVLDAYAADINADWEDRETTKIYAAQVLARLLDVDGIENIESALLDGASGYIILTENKFVEFVLSL